MTVMVLYPAYAFCVEPPRYNIEARIDTKDKTITATQKVVFTNPGSQSLNEIYFHIYPNREYTQKEKMFLRRFAGHFKIDPFPSGEFQTGSLDLQSVKNFAGALDFEIEGKDKTLLKVLLAQPLAPGETVELTLVYQVDIPHSYGRFGWNENVFALTRWYPILAAYANGGWEQNPFYVFHRPFSSDASYYSVSLIVPRDQVVIHTGELKEDRPHADGSKQLLIETPLPVREFTLAMSPDYRIKEKIWNDVTIKSFYLPGAETYAEAALESAAGLMDYYSKLFGEYPYSEFSIAPVYLGYGGEQMSNMIFIDTRVYYLPELLGRYFDFLIAHETGHQWFYNLVGMDEFQEMWLEEGIHSYFLLEYLEAKYGPEAKVIEWPQTVDWLLPSFSFRAARDTRYKFLARTGLDRAVVRKLSSVREPSSIFSLTYGKGSGVTAMLRELIGTEAFERIFARIFREFRFRNLTINDFIRIAEEESGQELEWFFQQWLYDSEICDYAVSRVDRNAIHLEKRGEITMPVDIVVRFKDGEEKTFRWDGQAAQTAITVEESKRIERVVIDPDQDILDIDRTNNQWPREIFVKPVPLYFGIYEIPVFLPDDSYNLVFGPEIINSGLGVKASVQKPYEHLFYGATGYQFDEQLHKSRVGYIMQNLFRSQTNLGFELENTTDLDGGEEDLVSGKVFLRRELWPAAYNLTEVNDHVTLYLIRNRSLGGNVTLEGLEDERNISYLEKDEAIVGTALFFDRATPGFDPHEGYRLSTLVENSGHFLGATQHFYRAAMDLSVYRPVTAKSKLAFRLKYGWGFPDDKNLYELGGIDGLRGFDRKTVRGSNSALGSVEYRFPLVENINWHFLDNWIGLDAVSAVVFFDAGQSWFDDISGSDLKRDAGIGLRFTVNVGSFLERLLVRIDAAQAINDDDEDDPRFWFGVGHAF